MASGIQHGMRVIVFPAAGALWVAVSTGLCPSFPASEEDRDLSAAVDGGDSAAPRLDTFFFFTSLYKSVPPAACGVENMRKQCEGSEVMRGRPAART